MTFMLYNTLARKKEEFRPLKKGEVGFYSCGPTVYNYPHIGNYRAFMCTDLLKRYLMFKGYKVRHVLNITDVDDKTIRDSQKEDKTLKEFTDFYADAFFEDLRTLNILAADHNPRATEYIKEMADLVQALLDKGHAYKAEDGIYFDISTFADYGKLSGVDLGQRKSGARVCSDEYDKESAHDFALWKFWDKADGDVFWETGLGKGRPGWHIECSAMSGSLLGKTFDIHSGGIDLIFPHHENEIAQSEAANKKKFVRYWFHNEFILVDGKKMSKSLGNFYTLRDVLEKGYKPKAIRYLLMSTHYRQQLNFTFEGLMAADSSAQRLLEFMDRLKDAEKEASSGSSTKDGQNSAAESLIHGAGKAFEQAMDDDLNISAALAAIFEFVKEANKLIDQKDMTGTDAKKAISFMEKIDLVLGILQEEKEDIPVQILELAEKRAKARAAKDFAEADRIRDLISEKGYLLDDKPGGTTVKKI